MYHKEHTTTPSDVEMLAPSQSHNNSFQQNVFCVCNTIHPEKSVSEDFNSVVGCGLMYGSGSCVLIFSYGNLIFFHVIDMLYRYISALDLAVFLRIM